MHSRYWILEFDSGFVVLSSNRSTSFPKDPLATPLSSIQTPPPETPLFFRVFLDWAVG